jgi:hypothetical protein
MGKHQLRHAIISFENQGIAEGFSASFSLFSPLTTLSKPKQQVGFSPVTSDDSVSAYR